MNDQPIIDAYHELQNQKLVARRFGCSQSHISEILRRNGICIGRGARQQKCDPEEVLRLWKIYGKTREVAKRLPVCQASVYQILTEKYGIKIPRGSATKLPLPMDEIKRRYLANETCGQIAPDYNTNPERIRRRLKGIGVTIRSAAESVPRGERNVFYKDGKKRKDPMHYHRRQVYEVAAICLGRPVPRGWVIHHKNENPRDNRPENLLLFESLGAHAAFHTRLLRLRRRGNQVDAIQFALKNGARELPQPPHPIPLESCTDQHALSDNHGSQEPHLQLMLL